VNWLWINIPLMAAFFLAMTGIPLWLVFKHPDRGPAQEAQGQALPDSVTPRPAAARSQTAPLTPALVPAVRLSTAGGDDEFAVPSLPTLVQSRR
jgi:hypothetical protein